MDPRRLERYRIVQEGMDPEYKPMSTVPIYEDVPVAGGIRSKRGIALRGKEKRETIKSCRVSKIK